MKSDSKVVYFQFYFIFVLFFLHFLTVDSKIMSSMLKFLCINYITFPKFNSIKRRKPAR